MEIWTGVLDSICDGDTIGCGSPVGGVDCGLGGVGVIGDSASGGCGNDWVEDGVDCGTAGNGVAS